MTNNQPNHHTPVLLPEVLKFLAPQKNHIILDGTLGLGGHAQAILEKIGKNGKLIGFDLDKRNLKLAKENLKKFHNLETHHANFCDMLKYVAPNSLDGILLDLGVSSLHFDDATRGFSFQNHGTLDMRFDTEQTLTAEDILNTFPEAEIADIFYKFGEIHSSRKIARQIIEFRKTQKFHATEDLVNLISARSLLPQVFQALRVAVNSELENLQMGLSAGLEALKSGGCFVVISFHSLEDRIVKHFFREQQKLGTLKIFTKKPVVADAQEIQNNSRSRSAKLRAVQKNNATI
jgi:16S rRNA (cytosine1402-N4)-methyltransferase